jgi:hypothetical protein
MRPPMVKLMFILVVTGLSVNKVWCQEKGKETRGQWYIGVGAHRSFFSRSDIILRSAVEPGFDFTLYNVRAIDDGGFHFRNGAPQYNYIIGYYHFTKQWGIEFGFDHIKYYVRKGQQVRMQGIIATKHYDSDTVLAPPFLALEHSDGANYALLKGVKWISMTRSLGLLFKGGVGLVIPKTNSTIMGNRRDDRYRIAGFVGAAEIALRYPFARFLFAEAGVKGAYANVNHFLIADGNGSQSWFGVHFHVLAGVRL